MIQTFVHNTTMMISFIYLFIRLKDLILKKTQNTKYVVLVVSLIMGILSVLTMLDPFEYKGMIFDLRSSPIFLTSYIGGWKAGLISAIFPTLFRGFLGGSNAWKGIVLEILLPIVIASIFRDSKKIKTLSPIIGKRKFLIIFLLFSLIKVIIAWLTGVPSITMFLKLQINTAIFSTIALFCMVVIINDASKSYLMEKELKHLSRHDAMTTLPNLGYFKHSVAKIMEEKIPFAVAMIDIDYFKKYNDTYGHPSGDNILREVAQLLKDNIRTNHKRDQDLVARYGGEEFIICFTNISDKSRIYELAERIRISIERYPFKGEETQPDGKLTVSIGISTYLPGKTLDQMIEEADQALYKSKQSGRNKTTM